jgi:hypothetical protein
MLTINRKIIKLSVYESNNFKFTFYGLFSITLVFCPILEKNISIIIIFDYIHQKCHWFQRINQFFHPIKIFSFTIKWLNEKILLMKDRNLNYIYIILRYIWCAPLKILYLNEFSSKLFFTLKTFD